MHSFLLSMKIRVKHMLTQGVMDQSPFTAGSRRYLPASTDRVLETNIENLLSMVSWVAVCSLLNFLSNKRKSLLSDNTIPESQVNYSENDSDCRRLLQLIHFGEKFNPLDCQKTCDNCSKMLNFTARDVTDIARQLVRCFAILIFITCIILSFLNIIA